MIQKINSNNQPIVKVFALGGLDENGKNLYCIETEDSIFVVECGSKYPDLTNPGVDIIIPDMNYLYDRADKVKAIIISHAHDDQYGALPFLIKKINAPIYTTETSAIFINADYSKKYKNLKFNFKIIKPSEDITIAGYKFHFFETTHAVMESFGFCVETRAGNIVYTGDYISDFGVQGHFSFDLNKIAKIANQRETLLMLCESAGADKPGIASPTHKITPHIKGLIEDGDKRVFIGLYTQNMYCINEVIQLAIKNNKRIVLTNSHFIDALPNFIANGDLIIPKNNQCTIEEMPRYSSSDLIILITGQGEELFDYLNDLARGETKERNLKITSDDVVVLACPPVPATEVKATDTIDSIYKTGATILNLNRKKLSSMHAQEEDIKMMVTLFKPKYYMPIKGEFRLLMANAQIALSLGYTHSKIFLLDNGMSISFDAASNFVKVDTNIKNGNVLVDGLGVGDVKSSIINERQKMKDGGVIILGATLSTKQHKLITMQDIQMRGFIYLKESESVVKVINDMFTKHVNAIIEGSNKTIDELNEKFIDSLTKEIKRNIGKSPLIVPLIIDIDNLQPKVFNYLVGDAPEPIKECERYSRLLAAQSIDLCCMGVGENGHIAFNDPPVAYLNDPLRVKIVQLDHACRMQQVGEGHFPSLEAVPQYALTLTISALCSARKIICISPERRKAKAVKAMLEGPVGSQCPASALRLQPQATLLLDEESAALLSRS